MRFIDADEFKRQIVGMAIVAGYSARKANKMCELIDKQPTAYDVDKVVKQLEKLKKQNPFINGIRDNSIEAAASRQTLDYAIDIIKEGGIDEKVNS
nr:MAG TPA: hypothetical protein [Caudoviricetes sp.]